MKKKTLQFVMALGLLFLTGSTIAQDIKELGFSYQAVARDDSGLALANKNIVVEISIRKGTTTGLTLWQETHQVATNKFGLFNVIIGKGVATGIGSLSSFDQIDWSSADYFTNVRADFGNGLLPMGVVQLQATPYAFVADTALAAPRFPLSELLDVDVTTLTTNDVLKWDGTAWIPGDFSNDFDAVYAKINADSTAIATDLATEVTDRIAGDNANATAIANNTADITTNAADLAAEITRATNAETAIATDLATEVTDRIAGDNANATAIADNTADITTNADNLAAEITRATNAETVIAADLATEVTDRIAGDAANATAIASNSTDIATNTTNITANTTAIATNTADITTNADNLAAEITRATNAETAIAADLATEVTDRIAGDAANATAIATNASDIATNATNITTNATDIANEVTRATNAETANATAITALETLANGTIYLGNASNEATEVTMSGDLTMNNAGATTIANDAVTTAKIADANVTNEKLDTGIDAVKLADGSVDNTELQYIDGATSNIQTQLNAKADLTLSNLSNAATARTNLDLGTIATQDASSVAITGGAINGTTIGASTPSTAEFTTLNTSGQVGIGTSSPNASAALDITSTTGSLLLPRLTTAERDALTTENGMVIYNSTLDVFQVANGGTGTTTISQNLSNTASGLKDDWARGQTFQATASGAFSINLFIANVYTPGDIQIRLYTDDTKSTLLATSNSVDVASSADYTFTFSGYNLVNTTSYYFETYITGAFDGQVQIHTENPYAGGDSNIDPGTDLRFSVSIGSDASWISLITLDSYTFPSADGNSGEVLSTNGSGELSWATTGDLVSTNNLSDLDNAATARTNLGLGTIATQDASSVAITGGAINGTTIGATTASTGAFTTLSASGTLGVTGATTLSSTLGVAGHTTLTNTGTASELRFNEPSASGINYTAFKAAAQAGDVTYTLPNADGTSGQVLSTDGAGALSWASAGGSALAIGDSYQGGIIFWLDATGQHGLIAATADQNTGIRWDGGSATNTRARADGIGAGLKNTVIIIANQGPVDGGAFAATVCNEYSVAVDGVTYGDWYLPSKYELNLLFLQKDVVGGFADAWYWSSSELSNANAQMQAFTAGQQMDNSKANTYRVRAVRAF